MILKYLDELAMYGEPPEQEESANVSLVGVSHIEASESPKVVFKESENLDIPAKALYYDDTDDGSNEVIKSWQKFYRDESEFNAETSPVWGSNSFFKKGSTVLGSVLKAGVYLRYSKGFREWLRAKDSSAASQLDAEVNAFESVFESTEKKKLPSNWRKGFTSNDNWALPIVAVRDDGRFIVLGLNAEAVDNNAGLREELDDEVSDIIDIDSSLELSRLLKEPTERAIDVVDGELHVRSGLGRNVFAHEPKDSITRSEYGRLLGPSLDATTQNTRQWWGYIRQFERRIPISPAPEKSSLVFFPEGELSYETLAKALRREQDRYETYRRAKEEAQDQKASSLIRQRMDETPILADTPDFIPELHSMTIVATLLQGSANQEKRVVAGVYPSVMLYYWKFLNHELLRQSLHGRIAWFSRAAITGQTGRWQNTPPSVYGVWTDVLTRALQRRWISMVPMWNQLPRYFKAFSSDSLIRDGSPTRTYLGILESMKRLQHLIGRFRETTSPDEKNLRAELRRVEAGELIEYGVMNMSEARPPDNAKEVLGEWYDELWPYQQRRIDEFLRRSWQGAPREEYRSFIRGAMVGMLLSELSYRVQTNAGRRFEATQGRHPATVRGEIIEQLFAKGIGLLQNVGKETSFNSRVLPYIVSCVPESKTTAFNNGLIMGMAYIPSKAEDKQEEEVDVASEG